jgi:DNA polymerase III sliding clamp (beta) subunit (PCNA family)
MTTTMEATSATVTTTGPQLRKIISFALGLRGSPASGAIRVSVSGAALIVAGYDFETVRLADIDLGAANPAPASVLVPGLPLLEAARTMPKGRQPVEVTVRDGEQVDLTAEPGTVRAARITVTTLPGLAWPALPAAGGLAGIFDGPVFRETAPRVCVAASAEPQLPWLGSVRMQADKDGMWWSATDRYKIAAHLVPWEAQEQGDWLFPGRELAAFAKVCDGSQVYLLTGAGLVGLTDGAWTVLTRQVTGEPVDVRAFIGDREKRVRYTCTITADAAHLAAVLGQAAKVKKADPKSPISPWVDVTAAPGTPLAMRLVLGETAWTGTADATVEGGKLGAGWNPSYLAAILGVLDGPVTIHLAPGKDGRVTNPVKITCPAQPDWTGMLAMIDPSKG